MKKENTPQKAKQGFLIRLKKKLFKDKLSYVEKELEKDKLKESREKKRKEKLQKIKQIKEEKNIRNIVKKKVKQKMTHAQRNRFFENLIEKAGWEIKIKDLKKKILTFALFFVLVETIILVILYITQGVSILKLILDTIVFLGLGTLLHYFLGFLVFFIFIDTRIYSRKKSVEDVLPEYLQLVAANIGAGMPIDQSLWLAIRPQFGVLAKEMELVAKKSLTGTNLNIALQEFAAKYDSVLLKRTINLIVEGIDAGGPLAKLLDKITVDIIDTKIMKKEMAANVMTYVIFIMFASIGAAPFMFGLANQLIIIITGLMGSLDISSTQSSMFTISGDAVRIEDFKIFAMMVLTITATFSGFITSVIKNGNIRDGLKNIPVLILISLLIYFGSAYFMGMMFSGFF